MIVLKTKGFTLVEILAVIIIIGIVALIAVPTVTNIIKNQGTETFITNKRNVSTAAENYYKINIDLFPKNEYETTYISLDKLVREGYIDPIKNPTKPDISCRGYVEVFKDSGTDYDYITYLNCEEPYITEGYIDDITDPGIATVIDGNNLTVIGYDKNHIQMSGVGNNIELTSQINLTSNFTIEYWFKSSRETNWSLVNSSEHYNKSIGHTNATTIALWSPDITVTLDTGFKTNQWQHFALVRQGTQVRVYRNGTLVGSNTWTGDLAIDRIGLTSTSSSWSAFDGSASDIRIWSVARTPSQIKDLMLTGVSGSERGLEGYWPINEKEGTTINNASNTNHGTITGSTLVRGSGIRRIRINSEAWIYDNNHTFNLTTGSYTITVEDNTGNQSTKSVSIP